MVLITAPMYSKMDEKEKNHDVAMAKWESIHIGLSNKVEAVSSYCMFYEFLCI